VSRQAIRVGFSGLTGMIGRNFLDLYCRKPPLRDRLTLVAFTRSADCPEVLRRAGVRCRRIDYADVDSFGGTLEDLDVFVHFAGATRTVRPAEFYAGNRDATATVVDAVSRFGGRLQHLVYGSSLAAVGPSTDPAAPRQEDWPPAPVSHYGRSKLLAEQEIRTTAVDWTILRLGPVWGPYDQDGLYILRAARRGILPSVGGGPHLFSYIHAQDLARLLPAVILNERLYRGTYNVSYDVPVDLADYCRRAREAMGLKPALLELCLPRLAGHAAMALLAALRRLSGRPSILQPDKVREIMVRHWIQDNRRLKEALGIGEIREQGALRETVAWFQARGLL
jgi:dihydroflavonol-4-reductase